MADSAFHDVQLVDVALKCAVDVYESERKPSALRQSIQYDELRFIQPSWTGTTKAASFTAVSPLATGKGTSPLLPALVIAIRGTESQVAMLVNLNGQPKRFLLPVVRRQPSARQADELTRRKYDEVRPNLAPIQAHGGFLNGAEALLPAVVAELDRMQPSTPSLHAVFTGHSAGGAIASLLFLKIFSDAHIACKFIQSRSCHVDN